MNADQFSEVSLALLKLTWEREWESLDARQKLLVEDIREIFEALSSVQKREEME